GASGRVGDGQRGGVGGVVGVGVAGGGSRAGGAIPECPAIRESRARAGALEGDGRALVAGQSRASVGGGRSRGRRGRGGIDDDGAGVVREGPVLVSDPAEGGAVAGGVVT